MAIGSSVQDTKASCKSSQSIDLQSFCQQQIEQLITQYPIFFARIVYYDALLKSHKEVMNHAQEEVSLSQEILSYLRSEKWLTEYPSFFSLNRISIEAFELNCYFCLIGYRNQKPEYIQVITKELLSPALEKYLSQSAVLLSKYLDIYLERGQQQVKIQLLEHIIQRAGHQLRNSLGLIGLYAHNLCLGLQDSPWQEQANIMRESIQELDANLTDFIYCGQSSKLKVSLQDLRSLIEETIKLLQPLINQKKLCIRLPDTSIFLAIDRSQMKQVFDNLLSNAIHFSPEAGVINCSWQVFQSEVIIKISDQGMGMSPEDIRHIFTPFYSRRPGGTGLGLTIAKKIVLDHQGSIWGQNLLGGGAQFSLILPRTKKD
ncbi:MAG: sensor histidine kinase [Calothrix sp. C42_A2020_038]|nr:sensor histidine kinase [Calothrix sp. C42_A2020_038]